MSHSVSTQEPKCWTCDEETATHSVFRDALNENELTCDRCFSEEYPEEEPEPYCFKDTTINTVNTDVCFCSVGGCVKPTEFDESEDENTECPSDDEEEGIPFEHTSAIRQVNIEIKNRVSKVGI